MGVTRLLRGLATGNLPLATLRESNAAERAVQARPGLFGQLARFCAVGLVSTAAYVALYVLLRGAMAAQGANALALLITALSNTAVNRRVTFGVRTSTAHLRHQLQGVVIFGLGLALTSGALGAAARHRPPGGPGPRDRRARHRRRDRHRRPLRALPLLGLCRSGPFSEPAVTTAEELMMTTDVLPIDPPVEIPPDGHVGTERPRQRRGAGWTGRLWRGRPEDPPWVRPALLALLVGTAVLYLWALGASGWANSFYSAAVQAGTKSWKAFFFGSSDASNFITVDKPPASLWVMELSARIFGLNSWSILVPQALEGVASVAFLYAAVRRSFRPGAALLAGLVLATTPVAALMFRYNNPDALLVLLLTVAAYATVRALERASTWWLVLAMARWAPASSPRCCRPSSSSPPSSSST